MRYLYLVRMTNFEMEYRLNAMSDCFEQTICPIVDDWTIILLMWGSKPIYWRIRIAQRRGCIVSLQQYKSTQKLVSFWYELADMKMTVTWRHYIILFHRSHETVSVSARNIFGMQYLRAITVSLPSRGTFDDLPNKIYSSTLQLFCLKCRR